MNSYFTSTLFRKIIAALSGLFLVAFLIGHLVGNLQLFIPGLKGQTQFNQYAFFMTTNPVIKVLSLITYISIILHVIITLFLVFQSRKSRPVQYAVSSGNNSSWSSRNMSVLGVLFLIFLVIHMKSFWYRMHFGDMPYQYLNDGSKIKDLYLITITAFKNPIYSLFYIFSMIVLGLHLKHGVESAIQTLGLKIRNYENIFKVFGNIIAFLIPAMFAIIPIYIYILQL
tara:strand:+ start:4442 stop:5122 length:681 start_codon:yes stop_codon:yes gene_type:complete